MPSERFFVHKEDGSLVRLKGRLVRFLDEEPPTGSDKSAIRTALEVSPDAEGLVQADVGTDPQSLVLHQHLGDLAYQSAEGISVGTVEAEALEVTDKITTKDVGGVPKGQIELQDSAYTISGGVNLGDIRHDAPRHRWYSGATVLAQFDEGTSYLQNTSLGIGTSSPDAILETSQSVSGNADGALLTNTNQSGSSDSASLNFGLGRTADSHIFDIPAIKFAKEKQWTGTGSTVDGKLVFSTISNETISERWTINSTGNLVASSGVGIDFGSVAGGTGTPTPTTGGLLNDYESGTWTPAFGGSVTAPTGSATVRGRYVKIGDQVTCWFYILMPGSGVGSGSGELTLTGLPFQTSNSSAQDRFTGVVSYTNNFGTSTGAPTALLASYNRTYAQFTVYENSGGKVAGTVYADAADVSFGTAIIGSLSYTTI